MTNAILPDEGEHLSNGWDPAAPPNDTLVRQAVLVHASWPVAVARSCDRPWRSDRRWAGGWLGDRGDLTNIVVLKEPPRDPGSVVADINALIPSHVPYFLISPWLADLQPFGLQLVGYPPLMARPPEAADIQPATDVEVREVHNLRDLAVAERVLIDGFPMPDLQPAVRGSLLGPGILGGPTRVWLGYVDGEAVATACAHSTAGATLVEFVATLASARGRGAGAAVTWAATRADPRQVAVLITSDDGRPVYEAMGYRAIERWSAWLRVGTSAA